MNASGNRAPRGRGRITARVRNSNIILLVVVLILILTTAIVMGNGVAVRASNSLAYFYSVETVDKFNLYMSRDLALVQKISRSKAVSEWFADEQDPVKRAAAFNEMVDCFDIVRGIELYFAIDESKNEYTLSRDGSISDFIPFDIIIAEDPYNAWYYELINSSNDYAFNIDIDKNSREWQMWINHKVMRNGEVVGVFCTGLLVDEMLRAMFDSYEVSNAKGYLIDMQGVIKLDSELGEPIANEGRHIYSESSDPAFSSYLDALLSGRDGYFSENERPEVITLSRGQYGYASVAPVPNAAWLVVTFFSSNSLFGVTTLFPLVISLILIFILYILGSTSITSRFVLNPLKKLTESVSMTGDKQDKMIFGDDRDDEFGELSRTIIDAMKNIEQRDMLFSSVNSAITVLLQAEVDEFVSALQESMGIMAEAVGADRVRLWRNYYSEGRLYCTQLTEWSEGVEPSQGRSITIETSYDDDLPGWEDSLSNGECINNIVRNMAPHEQERFAPQDIKSILIVPVFLRGEFWGFVGFNDCRDERLFTVNEESILRSASLLITNALLRNDMTRELASALENAQAASQAKTSFLSNMSHEIRTPINAIVGMTMIGKAAPDPERKDYAFGKIEVASSHLLGVINDVLDMSKIEANKFELSIVEFDFEKLLQKVVNVNVFRVNEKNQKLSVKLDPKIPSRLIGDDQRLAQVITNLLSNAVKFTPEEGYITLTMSYIGEEDGRCSIMTEITDTGVGISPEQQERLFNSFEQAESSTSRKFGGTGLGLAISKQIVELMGGEIWIKSELGEGSTFGFIIRLERAASAEVPIYHLEDLIDISLLVVDDDPETLEYFSALAERMGISCDTASGGAEALGAFNDERKYDICFIDWKMPEMDGVELTRRIRSAGAYEPIIIMISAYDWMSVEQKAIDAGVNGFLAKPIFPSDLIDCINSNIGTKFVTKAEHSAEAKTSSFPGRRILLAEDVDINREIVLALLEPTLLEIDCAVNGLEAVEMFSAAPEAYDMIFMDVQMPEMDGLTATQNIRALGFHRALDIPIVAMTANVFREDVEMCLAAGMNDHIGKPIDFDEMIGMLQRYVQVS